MGILRMDVTSVTQIFSGFSQVFAGSVVMKDSESPFFPSKEFGGESIVDPLYLTIADPPLTFDLQSSDGLTFIQ